ncbi:Sensor histidine kinase [Streptococcus pneumoniae]|nr:Sensor histidine kinase [Streptococcus pneumoniae]
MVLSLFIIGHMGLFFYNKIGSIISIVDLPTTNIIEPIFFLPLYLKQSEFSNDLTGNVCIEKTPAHMRMTFFRGLFCQSFSNLVKVVFHHAVVAVAFFTLFCDRVSKDLCVDWDVCVLRNSFHWTVIHT